MILLIAFMTDKGSNHRPAIHWHVPGVRRKQTTIHLTKQRSAAKPRIGHATLVMLGYCIFRHQKHWRAAGKISRPVSQWFLINTHDPWINNPTGSGATRRRGVWGGGYRGVQKVAETPD